MEKRSIFLSRVLIWLFGAALAAADVAIWPISRAFLHSFPFFSNTDRWVLIGCLYVCNVPAVWLLVSMGQLLKNLNANRVFVPENVALLRSVSLCCFVACGVCLVGCFFVYTLALVAAAAGFMGLVVRIVKNVFEEAIPMRDELDLTV